MFAKNKPNKSMVLLIIVSFWLGYVGLTLTQFYYNVAKMVDDIIGERQAQMVYAEDNQIPALLADNIDLVDANLHKAHGLGLIHFYILQKGNEPVAYYNGGAGPEALNYNYQTFNSVLATENLSYRTIKIMDYRLTVGIHQNRHQIIMQNLNYMKGPILRDLAMVTVLLSLVVYFFLKDIIDLSRILASKDRNKMANVRSLSKEGQTLLQAARSYESTQKSLEYENKVYTETLTPAIVHEMKSGRKAPYSFQTSLIRVDLNGFTQIFLDKKDEYVTEMMHNYFVRAREVIERYNGLIYQYVGDEIVFHIKQDKVNSQAMALACLRNIFEVAQEIEDNLPEGADHYFKVKGCFVLGKIRFVPQDSGFSLSGLPLIESARLLSVVEDKKKSSVTFYSDIAPQVESLCHISETKEAVLKGFSDKASLSKATEFASVKEVFAQGRLADVTYFRGDSDLIQIYEYLYQVLAVGEEDVFFKIFAELKHFKVRQTTSEQVAAFVKLFKEAHKWNEAGHVSDKVLASVISLSSNLVPIAQVENSLLEILTQCLEHKDPRTQANAIIVLGDLAQDITFLRKYIYMKHNRVAADALLVSGKKQFDKELAEKLEEFLESKNPLFKASGQFVVKHLADHYKNTDPVFFETNPHLKTLLKKAS